MTFTPDTVVVTAIFQPKRDAREALLEAMAVVIPLVHEEAGCLLYCIQEEPDGTIVMIENWESAEALDAHGAGAPVSAFTAAIADLLAEPVRVTRLKAIPIGDAAKGAL